MKFMKLFARVIAPVALGLLTLFHSGVADARPEGIAAQGCFGCHRGGQVPTVTITPSTETVALSQLITLTITVSATNGPTAGFYLRSSGKGTFSIIEGGTRLNADGVSHSAVKRATGNTTTFRVGWTAPATAGGVNFDVYALSANGAGTGGDGGGEAYTSFTYGCSGTTFYPDGDSDGYGSKVLPYIRECTKPQARVEDNTDCNDYEARVNPGQTEMCNGKDDNCDGQVDEGLPIVAVYEDKDGDGFGGPGTNSIMFCGATKGYGVGNADCDDNDPAVFPTAPEICNGKDDNCNSRVDDEAKLFCGVGWCRRSGEGCGSTVCTPGRPRAEMCNAFDDDCDGVADNGVDLCGKGLICEEGFCVAGTAAPRPEIPVIDGDGGIAGPGAPGPAIAEGGGCSVGAVTGPVSGLLGGALGLLALIVARAARRRGR